MARRWARIAGIQRRRFPIRRRLATKDREPLLLTTTQLARHIGRIQRNHLGRVGVELHKHLDGLVEALVGKQRYRKQTLHMGSTLVLVLENQVVDAIKQAKRFFELSLFNELVNLSAPPLHLQLPDGASFVFERRAVCRRNNDKDGRSIATRWRQESDVRRRRRT